jgi:hypothetical protein
MCLNAQYNFLQAGPDDQHIGERAAEEQDPDVAALAALFTSSATVSDEVPPLAKKKGGSKTRSESQRRDQPTAPEVTPARRLRSASARAAATDSASATAIESLRTADTALAESSVMGASSSAPGQPTMQLARKVRTRHAIKAPRIAPTLKTAFQLYVLLLGHGQGHKHGHGHR